MAAEDCVETAGAYLVSSAIDRIELSEGGNKVSTTS